MKRFFLLLAIALVAFGQPAGAGAATRKGSGQVRFHDENALSDKVSVFLFGASQLPAGAHYQGWIGNSAGTNWLDVGTISVNEKGNGTIEWVSPTSENLFGQFDNAIVTIEPDGASVFWPSSNVAYRGALVPELRGVVRALTVQGPDTPLPEQVGLATGLKTEARGLSSEGRDARSAAQREKVSTARTLDELIVNRVVGINDGLYGDWNGNGMIECDCDTYGILRYARTIQNTVQPVADNPNIADDARERATRIITATNNLLDWGSQIPNLANAVSAQLDAASALIIQRDIAWLTRIAVDGTDLNGDGKVDSEFGESGARSIYTLSQDLGRIRLNAVQ